MANNITGTVYPNQIPPITATELLADTTFMLVDGGGALVRILRSELYKNLISLGLKGDTGPTGPTGPRGLEGPAGPQGVQGVQGVQGPEGKQGLQGNEGKAGNSGWTPVLALVARNSDVVAQVVDWVGGSGTKPAVGQYISPTGLTSNINSAVKLNGPAGDKGVKGDAGIDGKNGWSPLLRIEVKDGVKYLYVYDWVGGTENKPTTVGFVTRQGIVAEPQSGGFDYDFTTQVDSLNLRLTDVNNRLVIVENNPSIKEYVNSFNVTVEDSTLLTPPATPKDLLLYIVPLNATGAWVGNSGKIAYYKTNKWLFVEPKSGYLAFDKKTNLWLFYDGTKWVDTQFTIKEMLTTKVDKIEGKVLSTNDFTNALKEKLEDLLSVKSVSILPDGSVSIELSDNSTVSSEAPKKLTGFGEYIDTEFNSTNRSTIALGTTADIPNNAGNRIENLPTDFTSLYEDGGINPQETSMFLVDISFSVGGSTEKSSIQVALNDGSKDIYTKDIEVFGISEQRVVLNASLVLEDASVIKPKVKTTTQGIDIYDAIFRVTKLI